jgi:hypothetical protein
MGNKRTSPRIDWLAAEPLAPYVDTYKQYLTDPCSCAFFRRYNYVHQRRASRSPALRLLRSLHIVSNCA